MTRLHKFLMKNHPSWRDRLDWCKRKQLNETVAFSYYFEIPLKSKDCPAGYGNHRADLEITSSGKIRFGCCHENFTDDLPEDLMYEIFPLEYIQRNFVKE